MADYVQWDSVPKKGGSGDKSDFLKLESGRTYKIRPVFDPVKFYKYFHKKDGRLRTAICGNPDTCPVRDRHPELKKPSLRFAAHIIDRNDGKVKVLEAAQSVFRPIGSSFEATGKNPGSGKDGSDWQVTVNGKLLNTTYDVVRLGDTPFSEEERDAIKLALDGDKKKLQKLYKVDTPEEIEEKLFGDWTKKETPSEDLADSGSDSGFTASPNASDANDDFDSNF